MKKILSNIAICGAVLGLIGEATTVQASEQEAAYPHVIMCEVKGVRNFAYLDRIEADGRAVYITPSGKAATVPKGAAVGREGATAGTCAGKTLMELVASGQAHFIPD